jgi:glycerol-3-phosphate O-acyltransferase
MGAYFIRRGERGALYRAVLARYVQMAPEGGVTQAFFPEGGLSLTGRLGAPKLGLLSYIAASDLDEKRPIVFVPVGLNYDRVIEDQVLTRASITGERKFRPPLRTLAKGTMRLLGRILRGRFKNFGTVAVGFGQPIYLNDFRGSKDSIAELGETLMTRIAEVIPLVPVPIVARILAKGPHTRDDLIQSVQQLLDQAAQKNVAIPVRSADQLVDEALRLLKGRKILVDLDGAYSIADHAVDVMAYYAATIEHHFT